MNICEKMFLIMQEKGIKNKDLMEKLNVSSSVVSTWKTRKTNPPAEYIAQICELLNIDVYTLLEIKNEYTDEEISIIKAYRDADQAHKDATMTLLNVKKNNEGKLSISKIG